MFSDYGFPAYEFFDSPFASPRESRRHQQLRHQRALEKALQQQELERQKQQQLKRQRQKQKQLEAKEKEEKERRRRLHQLLQEQEKQRRFKEFQWMQEKRKEEQEAQREKLLAIKRAQAARGEAARAEASAQDQTSSVLMRGRDGRLYRVLLNSSDDDHDNLYVNNAARSAMEETMQHEVTRKQSQQQAPQTNGRINRLPDPMLVEDVTDEAEDEFKSPERNLRPSQGQWLEPVNDGYF